MIKNTKSVTPGLSIIVPVYNVEKYLDQCLESLCNQTGSDYEIILINDGSTDNSKKICEEWERYRDKIRFFTKENEGLGPARNFGVEQSRYEYVTFIDSDDWIEPNYVEKMMECIQKEKCDIVYCDCCYYHEESQTISYDYFRSNLQIIDADIHARMAFGYPNIWGAVYRKDLWTDNNLNMPEIIYEDTAIYGVLLTYTSRIKCCDDALYVYRTGRKGSLMQIGGKNPQYMLNSLEHLIKLAKERDVFQDHYQAFLDFCIRQLETEWDKCIRSKDESKTSALKNKIQIFLKKNFRDWENYYIQGCVCVGSYNSCAVYNRVKMFRDISIDKYQFESLISLMSKKGNFSKIMVRDRKKTFRQEIMKKELKSSIVTSLGKEKVILVDFIDEIYDIIKVGHQYLNQSEALAENVRITGKIEIIPRESLRCLRLWKRACKKFIKWTRKYGHTVILLKLKLNRVHGNEKERKEFENIEEIDRMNQILEVYYTYFINKCPEAIVIEANDYYRFSADDFQFGCSPAHYNKFFYFLLAYNVLQKYRKRISG